MIVKLTKGSGEDNTFTNNFANFCEKLIEIKHRANKFPRTIHQHTRQLARCADRTRTFSENLQLNHLQRYHSKFKFLFSVSI